MNKYYLMTQKVPNNGTVITQISHGLVELKTGRYLPRDFSPPFVCQLLGKFANGIMSTFYITPAVVGKKNFYNDLLECGISNIEAVPAIIKDTVNNREINDYLLMNIIGRIHCADMDQSDYGVIGEGMNIINKLVIKKESIHDEKIFLVDEDTDCIVVNENVYKHLIDKGYEDIYFEEIKLV